jgi:hypothetical protein
MFSWKDKPYEHPGVPFGDRKKRGFILALYNLDHRAGSKAQRRTLPNVSEFYSDGYGRTFEARVINFYPSPLVRSRKVQGLLHLESLVSGYARINQSREEYQNRENSDKRIRVFRLNNESPRPRYERWVWCVIWISGVFCGLIGIVHLWLSFSGSGTVGSLIKGFTLLVLGWIIAAYSGFAFFGTFL